MAFKWFGYLPDKPPPGHLMCIDEQVDGSTYWSCICGFKSSDSGDTIAHAKEVGLTNIPMLTVG